MKVEFYRREFTALGHVAFSKLGTFDYKVDHKFTPLEVTVIDKLVVYNETSELAIEWCLVDHVGFVNRVFVKNLEFRVKNSSLVHIDEMLKESCSVFSKLQPILLLLTQGYNEKVRKKIRETVKNIVEKVNKTT